MSWWFFVTIVVGLSFLYYGYENKKKFDLKQKRMELEHEVKIKEMDLEQTRLELEMKKVENQEPHEESREAR